MIRTYTFKQIKKHIALIAFFLCSVWYLFLDKMLGDHHTNLATVIAFSVILLMTLTVSKIIKSPSFKRVEFFSGQKTAEEQRLPFEKVIDTLSLGVTMTDSAGKILYVNPAEARMHGYEIPELLGKNLALLTHPEHLHALPLEKIPEINIDGKYINLRKDGTPFSTWMTFDRMKDTTGNPVVLATCEDFTACKHGEEELQQYVQELRVLNDMSEALQVCHHEEQTHPVLIDACQQLFPADSGCVSMLDLESKEMHMVQYWGMPSFDVPKEAQSQSSAPNMLCPYRQYHHDDECLCAPILASGEMLGMLSLCANPCHSQTPDPEYEQKKENRHTLLLRIAEQYALALMNLRLREKLRLEAIRDPLTGLYNRRYMEESLKREAYRAKRRQSPVSILMLDIDHFKSCNDTYGHALGDKILRELGGFLLSRVRGEDIACRYGGEEFLLILPDTALNTATQRAEEMRKGIKKLAIVHQKTPLHITVSIGVATLSEHESDILHTVSMSDKAMYQAKASGRDQIVTAE